MNFPRLNNNKQYNTIVNLCSCTLHSSIYYIYLRQRIIHPYIHIHKFVLVLSKIINFFFNCHTRKVEHYKYLLCIYFIIPIDSYIYTYIMYLYHKEVHFAYYFHISQDILLYGQVCCNNADTQDINHNVNLLLTICKLYTSVRH